MSKAMIPQLASKLASRFDIQQSDGQLLDVLKATAFKGQVSDAQMAALLIVATEYGLNPWTKEIYAFPDKNNGIVPVVGVDGWARIINEHPQFDGMEFAQDAESCTCSIYRKDRGRPVSITEYMSECRRETGPWKSHPRRMLRHKAMIQAARLAFGYGGIYDQDEAERIVEKDMGQADVVSKESGRPALEYYPADKFDALLPKWRELIASGKRTPDEIVATVSSGGLLTDEQKAAILAPAQSDNGGFWNEYDKAQGE